jgi:hypothetical protein
LRIQQEGRDASVAKFPDRTVQNEMVEVHQSGKDQEAGREVIVKDVAGF